MVRTFCATCAVTAYPCFSLSFFGGCYRVLFPIICQNQTKNQNKVLQNTKKKLISSELFFFQLNFRCFTLWVKICNSIKTLNLVRLQVFQVQSKCCSKTVAKNKFRAYNVTALYCFAIFPCILKKKPRFFFV